MQIFVSDVSDEINLKKKDEECSRPGQSSDQTFLDKLSEHFLKHPHFECNKTSRKSWKTVKAEVIRTGKIDTINKQ